MTTLFVTHKDEDLHPKERIYDHRCWTGVRLIPEYFYLVKGENKNGVGQRFFFGHPRRAVEKAKELSTQSVAQISLGYWPEHEACLVTVPVDCILANPSQTEYKIETSDRTYTYYDHEIDGLEQAGPFWLFYSNGDDAHIER